MTDLETLEELESCIAKSEEKPLFIFKHSTACPVSSEALKRVTKFLDDAPENCPDFYIVKVIESRPVSNEIASKLSVEHKSPQLILAKQSQEYGHHLIWHISAGAINWAIEHHAAE